MNDLPKLENMNTKSPENTVDDDIRIRSSSPKNSSFSGNGVIGNIWRKIRFVVIAILVIIIFVVIDKYSIPTTSSTKKNAGLKMELGNSFIGLSGIKLLQYFDNNLDTIVHKYDQSSSPSSNPISLYYDSFMSFVLDSQREDNDKSLVEVLTRDVTPLNYVHSHNDYWRTLPVFDALLHGVNSIEADIWKIEVEDNINSNEVKNVLAVGHNKDYLNPEHKNFDNLYYQPLKLLLDQVNTDAQEEKGKYNGLFYTNTEMPTILYIDFKQPEINKEVYDVLIHDYLGNPDFTKYLTHRNEETNGIELRPLIIVLTGDFPRFDETTALKYENYIFLDLDIVELLENESAEEQNSFLQSQPPALVVSTSLSKFLRYCNGQKDNVAADAAHVLSNIEHHMHPLTHGEISCISSGIEKMHNSKLRTRIWGVPQYPIYLRDSYWQQMFSVLETDYLNVDNLDDILKF